MDKLLDEQLQNLQTDHIDYYLFHALSPAAWDRLKGLDVEDFVLNAKAEGRIRHIGFSSHNGTVDFKKMVDDYDWDFCQIQYNILDETNQAGKEGLKYAAAKGLGIVIMEPLRGGSLARTPPREVQAIWDEADVKRSPAEWALRWVWDHPEVTVVLSGMNDERHIEENLRVADEALPRLADGEGAGADQPGQRRLPQAHQGRLHRVPLLSALPCRSQHPRVFRVLQ